MHQTLGPKDNFLGLEERYSSLDHASIAIVPAPLEQTVAFGKGAGKGPSAILAASHHVEHFDEETKREVGVEKGIATLQPLNFGKKKGDAAIQLVHDVVGDLVERNKFVVTLGGEHSISSASIAAYVKRYPDLSVLQLDAHADLRSTYQDYRHNRACVMARVCEFLDPKCLVQAGVRALSREEDEFIRENGVHTYYAHTVRNKYVGFLKYWMDDAVDQLTDRVYLTLDVDVFDPSIMPATGTPEPNGLLWPEVLELIRRVGRKKRIVGIDVVEFAPIKGVHHPDISVAKLVSKILNYAC